MKRNKIPVFVSRHSKLMALVPIICFLSLVRFPAAGQESNPGDSLLILEDKGLTIENSIELITSKSKYNAIKTITGNKIPVPVEYLIINKDTLIPEEISTRGQTTLNFRRKSFSFSLKSKAMFRHGSEKGSFKKFFALSLSMDKDYINNRLAFGMMEKAHLFDLFYSFCSFHINGYDEGIYMVVERPEDWATKKKNSPFLIRRGYEHAVNKEVADKNAGKEDIDKYNYLYRQIYRHINKLQGQVLIDTISKYLDLATYMKWIAFNYFVRNGDYTDEVWFYYDPVKNKFSIIPWDYDDLFFATPHEGSEASREFTLGKMIFSAEDILDKKIASDPYVYKIYLKCFGELLDKLPDEVIKETFENTYAELCPYYSCPEILKISENDAYGAAGQKSLRSDLMNRFLILKNTRKRCLDYIRKNI